MAINTNNIIKNTGLSLPSSVIPASSDYVAKVTNFDANILESYTDKRNRTFPPPPDQYTGKNGNLPESELKYLTGIGKHFAKYKLQKDAADAFIKAVKAMQKVGLKPSFASSISAYRDYNGQYNVVDQSKWIKTGQQGPGKAKFLTRSGYAAACPGTSNHGLGVAVDLTANTGAMKKKVQCWMKWFGIDYGWYWAGLNIRGENWHFVYNPGKAKTFGRKTSGWNDEKKLVEGYCSVDIQELKP